MLRRFRGLGARYTLLPDKQLERTQQRVWTQESKPRLVAACLPTAAATQTRTPDQQKGRTDKREGQRDGRPDVHE